MSLERQKADELVNRFKDEAKYFTKSVYINEPLQSIDETIKSIEIDGRKELDPTLKFWRSVRKHCYACGKVAT